VTPLLIVAFGYALYICARAWGSDIAFCGAVLLICIVAIYVIEWLTPPTFPRGGRRL
jgi:hypothetical protein